MKRIATWCLSVSSLALLMSGTTIAQELAVPQKALPTASPQAEPASDPNSDPAARSDKEEDRGERLAEYLSGAKFVGKFTVEGKEDAAPKTEEYTISKCEKLAQPDMYRLTARIKYGEVDSEVPLDLKILWSGNTPVITMDAFWIPGMGTFGARVLIHSDRYAGTWQHDEVGGHLFGVIKQAK
jgi:hypothetical protein